MKVPPLRYAANPRQSGFAVLPVECDVAVVAPHRINGSGSAGVFIPHPRAPRLKRRRTRGSSRQVGRFNFTFHNRFFWPAAHHQRSAGMNRRSWGIWGRVLAAPYPIHYSRTLRIPQNETPNKTRHPTPLWRLFVYWAYYCLVGESWRGCAAAFCGDILCIGSEADRRRSSASPWRSSSPSIPMNRRPA